MNEPNKPNPPFRVNPDVLQKAQDALRNPQGPEVQEAVERSKTFYERNKKIILTGVAVVVVLKVNKRKVAKATAKAVAKELKKTSGASNQLPTMVDIIRDLRATPEMAYIDHGGNLLHLLRDHDVVVTIAGDFKNMNAEQIWEYAVKVLDGKSFKLKSLQ